MWTQQQKRSRFLNEIAVKEVETTIEELELKVVTVTNTWKTSVLTEEITRLEKQSWNIYDELHHVRPEISLFFIGRTKELEKLNESCGYVEAHLSRNMTEQGKMS